MGFWIALAVYGLLFGLSEILRPKPAKPVGRLGDFQFPLASEAASELYAVKSVYRGPNIVWWGDVRLPGEVQRPPLPSEQKSTCTFCNSVGVLSSKGRCRECGAAPRR